MSRGQSILAVLFLVLLGAKWTADFWQAERRDGTAYVFYCKSIYPLHVEFRDKAFKALMESHHINLEPEK